MRFYFALFGRKREVCIYLLVFDVTEWAALITLIAGFISVIFYGFKKLVNYPANENSKNTSNQMEALRESIDELRISSNSINQSQQNHLKQHDVKLAKHDAELENQRIRISNLERTKNKERLIMEFINYNGLLNVAWVVLTVLGSLLMNEFKKNMKNKYVINLLKQGADWIVALNAQNVSLSNSERFEKGR